MGEKPKIFLKKSKKRDKSLYNKYVKNAKKIQKTKYFLKNRKKFSEKY